MFEEVAVEFGVNLAYGPFGVDFDPARIGAGLLSLQNGRGGGYKQREFPAGDWRLHVVTWRLCKRLRTGAMAVQVVQHITSESAFSTANVGHTTYSEAGS